MKNYGWIFGVLLLTTAVCADDGVTFKKTVIDPIFRSEGVAVADFNNDGVADIGVGELIYLGPDWKETVQVADEVKDYDPKNYSDSFWCLASDLNDDGWMDLVVNRIPGQATDWWENPGAENFGTPWKRHLVTDVMSNENPISVGTSESPAILCGWSPDGNADSEKRCVVLMTPGETPDSLWKIQKISGEAQTGSMRYDHGFGYGDVNGDGLSDIVAMGGWYENPGEGVEGLWKLHAVPISEPCGPMIVYDFNGDGRADILSSSAHNYGFWWHEQNADGTFTTHEIDKADSQLHSLEFVDIDGDGQCEAVLGKRWQAHWQGDPGWDEAAVLLYWDWGCRDGQVVWTKHTIDTDSGVGIQFAVNDINGDGKLDVIVSNKKGVFLFEQE